MFEYYQNILCVHGGWLYKEAGLMTKYNYDNYSRRGPFRVMRNGRGKNTPALIAWVSIHEEYKEQIIKKFGDPEKTTKSILFNDYLERDQKAINFFATYTLDDGKAIAEDIQLRYSNEAAILNAIHRILQDRILKTKTLGTGGKGATWKKIADIVANLPRHTWSHGLPKNARSLQRRYKSYIEDSYGVLVHGGHGHKNSEKINDDAKEWTLARWTDRVKKVANLAQLLDEYNEKALQESWKLLKEEKTLYNYLYQPEVKCMWEAYRYGELMSKEKFAYQHSTKLPTMRDSLWYSDGTKLNYFYIDANGKVATCQVYEVMDSFSEVLLGYHISKTEDYEAQYHAYKMAVKNSGHRPYQLGYDNQGGHKKLEAGNFLNKLSRLSIKTQPYNGKSKTIESAFGRFQSQYLKQDWFFTGQNIDTKKKESKANMEMILANTKNLPTLKEIKEVYAQRRRQWNEAPHPTTKKPRLQMYQDSRNEKAPEIGMFEMVDIFWIERKLPVTCTAYGISFTEKKEKYTYMVYNEDRLPNVEWLANNVDRKLHVKFDPEDMSLIYLYEKTPLGLRFVTAAETKVEIHRGKQEQEDWEAEYIKQVELLNKQQRMERRDKMDAILEKHGMLPEQYGLNSPALKGIESQSKKNKKNKAEGIGIGAYQKKVSNQVPVLDDGSEDNEDPYGMY